MQLIAVLQYVHTKDEAWYGAKLLTLIRPVCTVFCHLLAEPVIVNITVIGLLAQNLGHMTDSYWSRSYRQMSPFISHKY
jgi:hypothetical protein